MDIQRVRIKVFADAPADLDVAPLLDIFSRWRHDHDHTAEWIDLADYAHVPDGPVALLVGKQGNLGYDLEDGRPGLIWRNKVDLEGNAEERVVTALQRGLSLFSALAAEPQFPEAIRLKPGHVVIELVDRLEAPNDAAVEESLGPAIRAALDRLYGRGVYRATRQPEAGRPFGYEAEADGVPELDALLRRLGQATASSALREEQPMQVKRVGPKEAAELIENEGYVYVDVRSVGEFEAGHPTGAYNIPILIEGPGAGLVPNQAFLDVFQASFQPGDKVVVGCRSGGRSYRAAEILLDEGFENVLDNYAGFEAGQGPGGFEPGWARAGLPVSRSAEAGRSWKELSGE